MSNRTLTPPRQSLLKQTHDLVFKRVHGSHLIYNCAWEDPRIDRHLLQLNSTSRVVMITSAGCNTLDYLLDEPAEIHAVDMNYRQNAVLHLKMALIRQGDHEALFEMFGNGASNNYESIYRSVREQLPFDALRYWDQNIRMFDPATMRGSFYYHGTAGTAAWLMMKALFRSRHTLRDLASCLLEAESLEEQADIYRQIEPEIWNWLCRWLVRQPMLMAMLGVPRPQIRIIESQYPGGLSYYVRDKIKHVLTEVPIASNYFWRVYMMGSYQRDCCPSYLHHSNRHLLAKRCGRVTTHNTTVSSFLREHPGQYTHFVLLDHQDWLAAHDPEALREEWELILQNCARGAKVLMRSAGLTVGFIPEDIRKMLRFHPAVTTELHKQDRVGTYGSTHLAEVL
ncbi:MAG: BtaA family protein [Verrucomicrobiaceae bacterium]|nr:BtaA family protein [Verrucomicrobiaceae bacterium]